MTEIKDVDREAAAAILAHRGKDIVALNIKIGAADGHHMPQAFASHREAAEKAERDRIVAWLRLLDHGSIQSTIRESCADAIEGGEHLK